MKKKVLILYSSATTACGIGTWVEFLSQALKEYAWEVTVGLAWGAKFHDPARVESFRPALKAIRMDGRSGTEEGRIQAIERAILAVNPDVVVLNVLDSAFEAVRRLRYRGDSAFHLIAMNHGNLAAQAACLIQNADVIDMAVCVSRLSYHAMATQDAGFAPERLKHISNAVDVHGANVRRATRPFRVGYVGRLGSDKRAEDIAPFYKALHACCPEAEMWVAGKGDSGSELAALARAYPGHFTYRGELSQTELNNEFYPELDVLVHFSPSEAWGYSIAEAMSFGIVPVTSAFRGVHTDGLVLEGDNALVFPVGDLSRAVKLVYGLYNDPDRLMAMGQAAAQHISRNFSLSNFARLWSDTLDSCMALPPVPAPSRPASLNARGPLSLPWPIWEKCRRLAMMRIAHASAGEEWPHFRCSDSRLIQSMEQALKSVNSESVTS